MRKPEAVNPGFCKKKEVTRALFFFAETFQLFFAETFWSLKHFGHLSRSCVKTRRSSAF